jgi:hypothetical protein
MFFFCALSASSAVRWSHNVTTDSQRERERERGKRSHTHNTPNNSRRQEAEGARKE